MGDTIDDLTGVLNFAFSEWRIRSAEDGVNQFQNTNDRNDPVTGTANVPDVGGDITVVSFNVLNFFTTLDDG